MTFRRALALVALGAIVAQGTAAADGPVRIGVVDLDQALNSTEEGKTAREELARKRHEAQARMEPRLERFKELQEELKTTKFALSEEALYQRQLDLLELKNEIDSELRELEGKFKVDQERIVGPLRKKLIEIVRTIGREDGFTIIVERGMPGLLYTREALDITDSIIEEFNEED